MTSFKDGEVMSREETLKQGTHKDLKIPNWCKQGNKLPKHCKNITCQRIKVPFPCSSSKWVYKLDNVLSKKECKDLIAITENIGYVDALINIGYGLQQKNSQFRNCKRVIIDDFEIANALWRRMSKFIPKYWESRLKLAFNERLRFLRYHSGEYFSPHFDGQYRRENGERSFITILMYLNDGYKGGRTNFINSQRSGGIYSDVEPESVSYPISTGTVILFEHHIYHEGAILESDVKYLLRTDVMYSAKRVKVPAFYDPFKEVVAGNDEWEYYSDEENDETVDDAKENGSVDVSNNNNNCKDCTVV